MSNITFTRKDRWFNWTKEYKITINKKDTFQLSNGEEKTIAINTQSKIQAKLMWWMGSDEIELNTNTIQYEQIQVSPTNWLRIIIRLIPFIQILLFILRDTIARGIRIAIACTFLFIVFLCFSVWRNKWLKLNVVKHKTD